MHKFSCARGILYNIALSVFLTLSPNRLEVFKDISQVLVIHLSPESHV